MIKRIQIKRKKDLHIFFINYFTFTLDYLQCALR